MFLTHWQYRQVQGSDMAIIQNSPPTRGRALIRYFVSVLFGMAVIAGGVKIAVDHWPCEFMAKGACSVRH